ncbi:MAG: hypothetical protein WC058_07795 [Phycisphaeraceae bacterium]
MHVQTFLKHWAIVENPFSAEEARDDPVFARLLDEGTAHPEFEKVMGQPDRPRAAVVFGEKGSGKTALRLMMERRIERYNSERTDHLAWVVRYDDLNGLLDQLSHRRRSGRARQAEEVLKRLRLVDHLDAILSLAVTRLVDLLLGQTQQPGRGNPAKAARKMSRQKRIDLAVLAALYDQPRSGSFTGRWAKLRRTLRLGYLPWMNMATWIGWLCVLTALGVGLGLEYSGGGQMLDMLTVGVIGAAGALLLAAAAWRTAALWRLTHRITRQTKAIDRSAGQLRQVLGQLHLNDLSEQPLPDADDADARYRLMTQLSGVLSQLGYDSVIVLIDRVDEPAAVSGDPVKMRSLIWPMLNNKFLQQDGVGIKLLLPLELRHLLHREDAAFFQQARLDKQHFIDRLIWSGTLLYDLCTKRLQACQRSEAQPVTLRSLFDDDVTERDLVDALDQMHQPRDAFKFVYQVIQEHCANVSEERPAWRIGRATLEYVRKQQSQRVQELYRGLTPA